MKIIIFLLAITFIFISCDNNDDSNQTTNPLNGKWFMDSISCFCPDIYDYTEEYVLWDINTNHIEIINYTRDKGFLASGIYNFTFNETELFIIDEDVTFTFEYTINEAGNLGLVTGNPEVDAGFSISFSPKEIDCIDNPLEDYEWLADIKFGLETTLPASFGSQIIQYVYNDECVYFINNPFGIILHTDVYNAQGEIICEFVANSNLSTCPDFFDIATNRRVLYNNITQNCDQQTIISAEDFNNAPNDELVVNSLEITENCLTINFSAGGCDGSTWLIELYDADEILESEPLQRRLRLSLNNTEKCDAYITKEISFNINHLQENGGQIILNIVNSNDQILYEY